MKRDRTEICSTIVGKTRAEYERAIALWALFLALVSESIAPSKFGELDEPVWFAITQLFLIYGAAIGGVTLILVANYTRIRGLEARLDAARIDWIVGRSV
ncbi:hypothetical protein [uncultured Litoreibacter sp.]|uniref:hypothetical protein n=1 Tax=uncultured Litoreibacter sp. TaxID=1392394 RepID=UPI002629B902|nr:hypothetical protein [uncultured Litoreibacter sp.]